MNKLLAEAVPLDNRLLMTDEDEYDKTARHVVDLFEKATDLTSTDPDVRDLLTPLSPIEC